MNREELIKYVKDNDLSVTITDEMSEDEIKKAIKDVEVDADDDELEEMDRKALKKFIADNELNIKVTKGMTDDKIRDLIREAIEEVEDDDEDVDEDDDDDDDVIDDDEMDESKLLAIPIDAIVRKLTRKDAEGNVKARKFESTIEEVKLFEKDDTMRVSIRISERYLGPRRLDEDTWGLGRTNIVYGLPGLLKRAILESEIGYIAGTLIEKQKLLNMVLHGAKLSFLVEIVEEGERYINPFTKRQKADRAEYETRYTHILGVKIGEKGLKRAEKIEDKIIEKDI